MSCIEGRCTNYLDGTVEDFSGIELYNDNNEIVIDGWMEFIHEKSEKLFIVYWDFLYFYCEGKNIRIKDKPGIPNHILRKLPIYLQKVYSTQWGDDVSEYLNKNQYIKQVLQMSILAPLGNNKQPVYLVFNENNVSFFVKNKKDDEIINSYAELDAGIFISIYV